MKNWKIFAGVFFTLALGIFIGNQTGPNELNRIPTTNTTSYSDVFIPEEFNEIIYSVKSADEISDKVNEIVKLAATDKYQDNEVAQLYSLAAKTLKDLKGIIWRIRFLVEPIDMAYVNIINGLRTFKRNKLRRGLHIDAIFDFLTTPNPNETILGQKGLFSSFHSFQDWMLVNIAPNLNTLGTRLSELGKQNPTIPVFIYDAGLLVGEDLAKRMTSQTKRYRMVMPAHLNILAANIHRNLGIAYYIGSYDLEKLIDFYTRLTKETFKGVLSRAFNWSRIVTRAFNTKVLGPNDYRKQLMRFKGTKLLTRREEVALKYLPESLKQLKLGVKNRYLAFEGMQLLSDLPNQNEYFLNASLYVSRPGITKPILKKRLRLLGGDEELGFHGTTDFTDRIGGESFKIDIPQIFDPNNESFKDLKMLFADSFSKEPEKYGKNIKTWKWNYEYGMAIRWPDPTFGNVLPDVKSSDDFRKNKLIAISRDASTRLLQTYLRFFQ